MPSASSQPVLVLRLKTLHNQFAMPPMAVELAFRMVIYQVITVPATPLFVFCGFVQRPTSIRCFL
jgi:hypothetical protein